MDLGDQAHWVKFMIRDRGSNFTAAFDAVLAGAGIGTVLCSVRTPPGTRLPNVGGAWLAVLRGLEAQGLSRVINDAVYETQLVTGQRWPGTWGSMMGPRGTGRREHPEPADREVLAT